MPKEAGQQSRIQTNPTPHLRTKRHRHLTAALRGSRNHNPSQHSAPSPLLRTPGAHSVTCPVLETKGSDPPFLRTGQMHEPLGMELQGRTGTLIPYIKPRLPALTPSGTRKPFLRCLQASRMKGPFLLEVTFCLFSSSNSLILAAPAPLPHLLSTLQKHCALDHLPVHQWRRKPQSGPRWISIFVRLASRRERGTSCLGRAAGSRNEVLVLTN